MRVIAALFCAAPLLAFGQACLPNVTSGTWEGGPLCANVTKNGQYIQWVCIAGAEGAPLPTDGKLVRVVRYVGLPSILHLVGGRITTIVKSADPLASLRAAGTRYPIAPLRDPEFAAINADADDECGWPVMNPANVSRSTIIKEN